jgi:hypothetical protein
MMHLAPVAIFAYNRADHLRRTLDALAANPLVRDSEVFAFSDAPSRPDHVEAVATVRQVLHAATGFARVHVIEREGNLGLTASITDGVSRVCREHGRVIVLEDDIVVAPRFLEFMNRALDRYAGEPRVMQVSGYMYPIDTTGDDDALFLPMISCWGWATWARAWENYDPQMTGYERLESDPALRARFNLNGAYDYFGMLEDARAGRTDSWGIRWHLSVFMREGLVVYPRNSLVQNVGADGSGVHGAGAPALHPVVVAGHAAGGAVRLPEQVTEDAVAMRSLEDFLRGLQPSRLRRFLTWLPLRRT